MKKQWQIHNPRPETVRTLSRQLGCSPLIARLLAIRGVGSGEEASRFMNPSLSSLTPPQELPGMEAAVRRIHRGLAAGQKILVYGDYDADGITATALLVAFLRRCGARVSYYIPHRIADGYGLGADFIRTRAMATGTDLIITADCGSGSGEAITLARKAGIHTIVTDHHPVIQLPDAALAVVNPQREDSRSNLAPLAGVGVAFYLVIALRTHLRTAGFWKHRREPNLKRLCDLVALGTVADVVPLIGENRTLTAAGLQQINRHARPGIDALMRMSGSPGTPVDAESIAFKLAPRLNAAGRLAHARMACELLLADSRPKAARLARALCRLNSRRQTMENQLLESIMDRLTSFPGRLDRSVLVVDGDRWHEGILGIVAARLVRQFNRPAVVISSRNGTSKGSGRSIDGIDLSAALEQCRDLLDRFGGHPLAAGLSLKSANTKAFKDRLETIVGRMMTDQDVEPKLSIDARVPLGQVTPALMASLERLGPFGQGNPYPLFMDTGVRVHACKPVGDRHRRMVLECGTGTGDTLPAIQFNITGGPMPSNRLEKIAYRPQWNYWKGRKRLQLMVEDLAPES
ncbi:single-stranded-DNA-specific exonuclease RecJ [Desulfosarcina alkanivorans]|uniref:Single-stranded-DNA-specific exonuclease RecJ n=1 Tax=Desulfosarcina alkanivorans TaxID=571177 RepID=A0A5K7YFN7_9BACT|nr:single-stranded-DNA-specific exonuclease RecJ [Desulfosarcina alkanivorans]BBO66579.1 single-stranded-DNA-specific exonuclease RecJ [Desulfosarcina alkanivorans]